MEILTPCGHLGAQKGSIFPVPQGLLGGINRLCIQHTSVVKKPSKHVGHPILARFDENRLCFPVVESKESIFGQIAANFQNTKTF